MTGPRSAALKNMVYREASLTAASTQAISGPSPINRTIITLQAKEITVANTTGVSFGGVKIFDFPKGRIWVMAALVRNLTIGLTNDGNATPIDGDDNGDFSMGTTAPTDGTLTGTDVDLCPSTALELDTTGTSAVLAASAFFDGTSTAKDVYFNMLIDDADVADAASDVLELNGEVEIYWVNLGDLTTQGGGRPPIYDT